MLLNCGVGEDSWESLGLQTVSTSPSWMKSVLNYLLCWSWNSNTLVKCCEELTHWKRLWWWEGLRAGGEGDDRGWDGWMTSPTWWTWVWVNSGSWWWSGRPGVLRFMGSQRVGHDWVTDLIWSDLIVKRSIFGVEDFVTVEITKWASSQLYWEDGYLNCKSISTLGTYVKWKVRITIKGHTTEVFWKWEKETNIYWVLYARKCARHPHTSLAHLQLPAIL